MPLIGIMCITQPTFLFGAQASQRRWGRAAIGGGIALSVFNVLSRMLGRANICEHAGLILHGHRRRRALIAAVAQAVGPSAPLGDTRAVDDPAVWLYVLLYCGCILVGQLFLALDRQAARGGPPS